MSLDRLHSDPKNVDHLSFSIADHGLADAMARPAETAADLMRTLGHSGRLMILCHLAGGERSVTELETLLGQRQAAVSQQLARLRMDGLVTTRREGKAIIYSVQDPKVTKVLRAIAGTFAEGRTAI